MTEAKSEARRTKDERSSNDECRMTKESRMTNYRKRRVETQGDLSEEEFWGTTNGTHAVALREEANDGKPVFDLEERTARFGEAIIGFAKKIPLNPVNNRLIEQLVGAGTVSVR